MILLWFAVSASLLVALVAWSQARRAARQLAQLSEMYWELRYQYGELRVRMQHTSEESTLVPREAPASPPAGESFVPLSSLKR
jgi:hypothetical protein